MKGKLFKHGGYIYRLRSTFGTLVSAKKVDSHTLRSKMGEHTSQFELPNIKELIADYKLADEWRNKLHNWQERKIYDAILNSFPATHPESAYDKAIQGGVKYQFIPT